MNRTILAMLVIAITSVGAVAAQPLIGDPVPALGDEVRWALGQPNPRFAKGKIYVLDFWATWCPPCYPLMDHLSEIQDRYDSAGLVVIGIAVGTDVGMSLERFLEKEGNRISYAIAEPKDEDRLKALLVHPSIMEPNNFGLPFVMIIDRQGRLAWVNDPFGADDHLDERLAAIIDGSYDLASSS